MTWLRALWDAMWPNVFAPSAFSIAAVGLSHWRTRRHIRASHEAQLEHQDLLHARLKTHVTAAATRRRGEPR
jgi:hypothetical protein